MLKQIILLFHISGSSSRICYINNEIPKQHCRPIFRETGDLAHINEKGIFLIGRKNRVIKRFGHRVNLTKMESTIFEGTGLDNKCVFSQENNKILTFILIRNLHPSIKEKILDKLHVKLINILPEESFPDLIEIVETFPLTSHGKIDEKALKESYIVQKTNSNCVEVFFNLWCKYFRIAPNDFDSLKNYTFFEMGGNSILALQFLREFQELNLEYPDEIVTSIFGANLGECLNILKTFKLTRKRCNEAEEPDMYLSKKEKMSAQGLKILWSYDLKACVDGSPVVFEKTGSIYVSLGSFSHVFVILNEKGEHVFKKVLPQPVESMPIVSACTNYILTGCYDGLMYCVDLTKNQIIWKYQTSGKIKGSGCFCRNGSAVVFGSYDKTIYCVLLVNGHCIWQTLLDGSICSNPVYDETENRIFTASTSGTCFSINGTSGEILWKYKCGGPVFGSPCLLNSNQYVVFPVVQGVLHCLSVKNGELAWMFQAAGYIFSSLVLYKECLLFGCHDKNIYIAKVSPLSCNLVDKVALNSEISSTPFACSINSNDVIVAACNSGIIYVTNFNTCAVTHSVQLPGEVFSSPFVYNNKIYVGCRDNSLYCIEVNV